MKLYEKSFIIDLLETKLLEQYGDYTLQGCCNNRFITYLYRYLRENTYSGEHYKLLSQLNSLKTLSSTLIIKEEEDKQTYTITETDSSISLSNEILARAEAIFKNYPNYEYKLRSENRIVVKVLFGWLPENAGSWLNLLNNENLLDYHIDGITLVPNTRTSINGKPDSGFVCYKINNVKAYDTIMFLRNSELFAPTEDLAVDYSTVKFTFASLLEEIKGTKGATLNRIVETSGPPDNCFYEVGPYDRSYLTAEDCSLIIQVPYDYVIDNVYSVYNVANAVNIKQNPDIDINSPANYYFPFKYVKTFLTEDELNEKDENGNLIYTSDENDVVYIQSENKYLIYINNAWVSIDNYFSKLDLNLKVTNVIADRYDLLNEQMLVQYIFGDIIWRKTDSKIIAYLQNLLNVIYEDQALLMVNGVWSDKMSKLIVDFKTSNNIVSLFTDDVVDKSTEEILVNEYQKRQNNDFNNLFQEW